MQDIPHHRLARIDQLKAAIRDDAYETPAKLDAACDRLATGLRLVGNDPLDRYIDRQITEARRAVTPGADGYTGQERKSLAGIRAARNAYLNMLQVGRPEDRGWVQRHLDELGDVEAGIEAGVKQRGVGR